MSDIVFAAIKVPEKQNHKDFMFIRNKKTGRKAVIWKKLGVNVAVVLGVSLGSASSYATYLEPSGTSRETRGNEDGGGNSVYLDRHHVSCGDRPIKTFHLIRPTNKTIAYAYTCGTEKVKKVWKTETRANDWGKGNSVFLDRHHVNCQGGPLLEFRLFRPTTETIAYQYTCGKEKLSRVWEAETRANEDGGGNSVYLDRHHINCKGHALSGFRLIRPTNKTIAYKYTCGD